MTVRERNSMSQIRLPVRPSGPVLFNPRCTRALLSNALFFLHPCDQIDKLGSLMVDLVGKHKTWDDACKEFKVVQSSETD